MMNVLVFFYQFMQGGPQYYLENTFIAIGLLPDVLEQEHFVSFFQKSVIPTVYGFNYIFPRNTESWN